MTLTKKILLSIVLLTLCMFLAAGYYIYKYSEHALEYKAYQQLSGSLELAEGIIDGHNQKVTSIASLNAQNRNIIKALDLGINRGIAQELNDSIKNSHFINYIFIIDYEGYVFSTSTVDYQSNKFFGEKWLNYDLETQPQLSQLLTRDTIISTPNQDPFLSTEQGKQLSQWVVSPIYFRDQLVGWSLLSFDWQRNMLDLLSATYQRLEHAHYPVANLGLSDQMSESSPLMVGKLATPSQVLQASKEMYFGQANYLLSVAFDAEQTLSSLSAIKQRMLFIFVIAAIALTLAMWLSIRTLIINPLEALNQNIIGLDTDNLDARLPASSTSETNSITQAINQLLERLRSNTISIERLDEEIKAKQTSEQQQKLVSQKLEAILDTAADGIVTIDREGKILSFNQAAQMMFGYLEQEAIGMQVEKLMPNKHGALHQAYIDQYLATGHSKIIGVVDKQGRLGREFQAVTKQGERFPILLSIAQVETSQGMLFSGVIKDISKQKQVERDLIFAKEEAEQAALSKSEFLAVMSHEIRTPMNGIIGMLDLLQENDLNHSQAHQAYLAHTSALSLLTLLNDILDFSKIEADKLELEQQHFDLRHMLGDFAEAMSASLTNPNVEIILDTIDVEHSMIIGDSTRIRQIFSNLVSNALKFTEHGEVIITARLEEYDATQWQLKASVKDSGIGIPPDRIGSLFDKFSQVDSSTTRRYGGTGLGLAIVKKLCQLMGGNVSATSQVAKGSEFSFDLLVQKSNQSEKVIPSVDISLLNILVVDDNAINQEVILRQLQRWGASAVSCSSAFEAISLCQRRTEDNLPMFDIAFLDMQMAEKDGLELSKQLSSDPSTQSMKLIMMTSIDNVPKPETIQTSGLSGYFVKPATTKDLFNALKVIASPDFSPGKQLVTHNYLSAMQPEKQAPTSLHSDLKLLVVEDNRVNQIVITGMLHKLGLDCTITNNGREALSALSDENNFDIVLMDCQMPEMDGYEATHRIRSGASGERVKNIPIIAMTANAMESDRNACKHVGMNDFLTKPVNRSLLEEKLLQWSNHH